MRISDWSSDVCSSDLQIGWRLAHPNVPIFEAIGIAAVINLAFNGICLWLLTPYRRVDVNMASAWECSRNEDFEGFAVLLAAAGLWQFAAGWAELGIAAARLVLFLSSAWRVVRTASVGSARVCTYIANS